MIWVALAAASSLYSFPDSSPLLQSLHWPAQGIRTRKHSSRIVRHERFPFASYSFTLFWNRAAITVYLCCWRIHHYNPLTTVYYTSLFYDFPKWKIKKTTTFLHHRLMINSQKAGNLRDGYKKNPPSTWFVNLAMAYCRSATMGFWLSFTVCSQRIFAASFSRKYSETRKKLSLIDFFFFFSPLHPRPPFPLLPFDGSSDNKMLLLRAKLWLQHQIVCNGWCMESSHCKKWVLWDSCIIYTLCATSVSDSN